MLVSIDLSYAERALNMVLLATLAKCDPMNPVAPVTRMRIVQEINQARANVARVKNDSMRLAVNSSISSVRPG